MLIYLTCNPQPATCNLQILPAVREAQMLWSINQRTATKRLRLLNSLLEHAALLAGSHSRQHNIHKIKLVSYAEEVRDAKSEIARGK